MKNNKKPAWVLFEQLHINVDISTNMSAADRAKLRKALNAPAYQRSIINMTLITGPTPPTDVLQTRVTITK